MATVLQASPNLFCPSVICPLVLCVHHSCWAFSAVETIESAEIVKGLANDPKILILDEATSSLDSESEAMIQHGLNFLMKGRTTFVIAHRLSTIRSADQILVLEDGIIVERGSHDELMATGGTYRRLYDLQFVEEPAETAEFAELEGTA